MAENNGKVYLDVDILFGGLEIAGNKETNTKSQNGRRVADTIEYEVYPDKYDYVDDSFRIVLPANANRNLEIGARVRPINLYNTVASKRQGSNNGYPEYTFFADDLVLEGPINSQEKE